MFQLKFYTLSTALLNVLLFSFYCVSNFPSAILCFYPSIMFFFLFCYLVILCFSHFLFLSVLKLFFVFSFGHLLFYPSVSYSLSLPFYPLLFLPFLAFLAFFAFPLDCSNIDWSSIDRPKSEYIKHNFMNIYLLALSLYFSGKNRQMYFFYHWDFRGEKIISTFMSRQNSQIEVSMKQQ